ncbi:MAG: thiamine phosphate synthase [Pyrinomonadaceae bacterium]
MSDKDPLIYLITPGNLTAENFESESPKTLQTIRIAAENNIGLIQIREKNLPAKFVYELALRARKVIRASGTRVLINERIDIAIAANADGVHLTSTSLPVGIVRRLLPEKMMVGVSTHTFPEAKTAKENGADLIVYGPVFKPFSKTFAEREKGLADLNEVSTALRPFPVIALGGIGGGNINLILASEAKGFASISFLNDADNLRKLGAGTPFK